MGKWIAAPGDPPASAVLYGIAVVLLLASLGLMVAALFGGPKDEAAWDRWTRRVLLAGGGAFLVFHLEAARVWILWPPGGFSRVPPWADDRILGASWLGWASLAVVLAAVLLLHRARAGREDRAGLTWLGVLLPLGVLSLVLREIALANRPETERWSIHLFHAPPSGLVQWQSLLFPLTGWALLPAALPVVVGILARLPSVSSRLPKLPSPTAPAVQIGCLLALTLVVLHLGKLLLHGGGSDGSLFLLGIHPRQSLAVLLGGTALLLFALGWEGWERTLGMRRTRATGTGAGGGGGEEPC